MNRKILLFVIPVVAYLVFSGFHQPNKLIGKDKFYISSDMGQTWEQINVRDDALVFSSLNFLSIAIDPLDSKTIYLGTRENGLYKSSDKGKTWKRVWDDVLSKWANVYDIALDSRNIYIATYQDKRGRFFRSRDGGETWDEVYVVNELARAVFSIAVDDRNIYIGTAQGGLLKSGDQGDSWQIVHWFDDVISDIAISGNEIYVSTFDQGMYRLKNGEWVLLDMEDYSQAQNIEKIALGGGAIYTASRYGVLVSHDRGETWEEIETVSPANTTPVMSLSTNNFLFYGASSILYNSLDGGKRWIVNQLPDEKTEVRALAVDPRNPNNIYVGMHESSQ